MPDHIKTWHRQLSFARREASKTERIWARDRSLFTRLGSAPLDEGQYELGKEYSARSLAEVFQILAQTNDIRKQQLYETLTEDMRHACFYYCIDVPTRSSIKWNDFTVRFAASITIQYFVRHLRSAFASLTRTDVDESNIVCLNASSPARISWTIIFRRVIFYDHHVSMREYIEEALVGLYSELRQLRRQQLQAPNGSTALDALFEAAISHGLINSTVYGPYQSLPLLGSWVTKTQQVLRLVPSHFAADPDAPAPSMMSFCACIQHEFRYTMEQWQSCLVYRNDNFVVMKFAIQLWPLPDSICTPVARKTYPEGYQDLPDQNRYVNWAPKFLRHQRTVWDRMKQEVIDQFRQKLVAMQNAPIPDLLANSIDGDRPVIRDDGTRWRAQDLEEGDAVFCPLHQAREGESRAALFTYWLSTLSVDGIRAEAVIFPSRFRPGLSNGRVIFCIGACKRMISIMEVPEQGPFRNDFVKSTSNGSDQSSGYIVKASDSMVIKHLPSEISISEKDVLRQNRPDYPNSNDNPNQATSNSMFSSPPPDCEFDIERSRLFIVEGSSRSGKTARVSAFIRSIPNCSYVVVTSTTAAARKIAKAYVAHCYTDPGIWAQSADRNWTSTPASRCTIAFSHFGTLIGSLASNCHWQFVIIEDAFNVYLLQQFGLADETEPNVQALTAVCLSAKAVFAVGPMIPSPVIDFVGRNLCRIDLDMHPNLLQTFCLSASVQQTPIHLYERVLDALDNQILLFLQNFDTECGMSAEPAITFCSSIEFSGLLQWIFHQVCHQYGYDGRRIRIYNGSEENRESLASDRFSVAQALEQVDELIVTSLTLSGYNLLHLFRRHFTYLHDGVFSQTTLARVENRIAEFGLEGPYISKHVWFRTSNVGFSPLNAKRLTLILSRPNAPCIVRPTLPGITELSNSFGAHRGNFPDDWLPSDFKYSAESSSMYRLRWLFSTISSYFDLHKKTYVPEWMCDADCEQSLMMVFLFKIQSGPGQEGVFELYCVLLCVLLIVMEARYRGL